MPWQLVLIFHLFAATALSIHRRAFSQKTSMPATLPPLLYYWLVVVPAGIAVSLVIGDWQIDWTWHVVGQLALMGSLVGLFNWLSFRAFGLLSVAVFQTIFQLFSVTVAIGAWVFLGEELSTVQIAGGVMLIGGALLAAQSMSHEGRSHTKGVVLAVIGSIALGFGVVTEKSLLDQIDIGTYFAVGWGAQAIAIAVIGFGDLRRYGVANISRYDWTNSIIAGFLILAVGFSFIYTITAVDNVAIVALASAFILPMSAIGGYFLLHEKDFDRRLIAALLLGFVGLIITVI